MAISRRDFLTLLASGTGGITLGTLGLKHVLPPLQRAARSGMGLARETWLLSVCGACPAGCGIRARVVEDRLVGVSGNARCPLSQGGLCARGLAEVEALYDPDRLLGPVTRDRRGAPLQRGTWQAALELITSRLRSLQHNNKGSRVAVFLSESQGLTSDLFSTLLHAIGSPHLYRENILRDESAAAAAQAALGWSQPWNYDLAKSSHIYSFGAPILDGWLSPTWLQRCYGQRRGDHDDRLQITHIGSRLSQTALHADRFIQVEPGSEQVLALGLAATLMREGLVDRAGLEKTTLDLYVTDAGQADRHTCFHEWIEGMYGLRRVAQQTGLASSEILRLARQFARDSRAVAVGERLAGSAGLFGLLAVNSLNALTGRVGAAGGVVCSRTAPVSPLSPELPRDGRLDRAPHAVIHGASALQVAAAMEGETAPFDMIFVQDAAVLARLGSQRARAFCKKIPLVVSLSSTLDLSAELADVVLPQTTRLEQDNDVDSSAAGFASLSVSRPVFAPLVDARPAAEVARGFAAQLGATVPKSLEQATALRLKGLFDAKRGMPYDSEFKRGWLAQMEESGWWQGHQKDFKAFVRQVYAAGGWVDPHVVGRQQAPSSYRFRVRSQGGSNSVFSLPGKDEDLLPHPEGWASAPSADETPAAQQGAFRLLPFALATLYGTGSANRPSLQQLSQPTIGGAYRDWIEINPQDAQRLGLKDDDEIEISSAAARGRVQVRLYDGVPSGAVAMPFASQSGHGRYGGHFKNLCASLLGDNAGAAIGSRLAMGVTVRLGAG